MDYKKKLIEVALPLEAINKEAAKEKSIRHGHPSTLHLWWSRKPLAACRAVLFASLVDDPSECVAELMKDSEKRKAAEMELKARKKFWDERTALLAKAQTSGISAPPPGPEPKLEDLIAEIERERLFDIIRELVKWENSNNEPVLNAARAEIMRSCNGNPPPIYDPFCGGGSIPLEAQRLGLEAHASDLNPVPVLINKALIEIPPKYAGMPPVNPEAKNKLGASGSWKGAAGLAEDIRYYGQYMRDEAEKHIGHLYPKVKLPKEHGGGEATVIAWIWARTVASPNPAAKGAHVPLVSKFQLSSKSGKEAWAEPILDLNAMTYHFEVHTGSGGSTAGTVGRNGGICILTRSPITLDHIRAEGRAARLGTRLMGIVAEGPSGRVYLSPDTVQESVAEGATPQGVPDTDLPKEAVGFRVQNYGITKHRQLFTNRQLVLLTTFGNLVEQACAQARKDSGDNSDYATAVATYLGLCASKAAVFHSTLARWRAGEGKSAPAFGRQTVSLVWEFAEVNPFAGAGGDINGIVDGVKRTLEGLPAKPAGHAEQGDACTLIGAIKESVFSTDPPYYDNISYGDLSDYCYVWLRRCLRSFYHQLLGTLLVPKAEELVADPFRHGGKDGARDFFENGMSNVFRSIRQASHSGYPTTIYYAFKQTEEEGDEQDDEGIQSSTGRASTGWETFLSGVVASGWQVDGTWPMRTEGKTRMRSMSSNALASSIILVCRARPKDAPVASRRDFLAALKRELPEALRNLQKGNIAPVDLAQAAIGPGMAVFSRYAKVLETDGSAMSVRSALTEINKCLDEVLAEQEGEFDADTRWALAWFDQSGFNEGAYGVAETLCTAKNTSVSGMAEAGILVAKGGKVRLLKEDELDADWNPATQRRLPIWTITHHLIRRLEQGESGAAELIHQLGAKAEIARDLSYRLYTICERRKWAQEAIAYNTLVLSWPDLTRLAQEQKSAAPTQRPLI
jgi:putative DNA methylase